MQRRRADLVLVERGLFESRARARAAIEAGLVVADADIVGRPSDRIRPDAEIAAEAPHPWVSRGGLKLAAALDAFGIDPAGRECLDVGASTGGFTDVLLARGAARVHAVDVGRGQLHPRLAGDPRVISREETDARGLDGVVPAGAITLATVDVSFISATLIVPELARCLIDRSQLIVLAKPQFEVGRSGVGRGGIVREPALRQQAVAAIEAELITAGFAIIGSVPSPIAGGDGNVEFLIGAERG